MSGNTVTLTFAGDNKALTKTMGEVGEASKKLGGDVEQGGSKLKGGLDRTSTAVGFLMGSMTDLGGAIDGVTAVFKQGATTAQRLARAQNDVEQATADYAQALGDAEQAQLDYTQSQVDGKQAALDLAQAERDKQQSLIDITQAQLDAKTAQAAYTEAVKAHGKGSDEATQAAIDLRQAQEDLRQAQEDGKQASLDAEQAQADSTQANIDAGQALRDQKQATIDAKGAQLDLNDANTEARPPGAIAQTTELLNNLGPAIFATIAASQLLDGAMLKNAASFTASKLAIASTTAATVAQSVASGVASVATGIWSVIQLVLNAEFWAFPVTWIVAGILVLIGIVVLIATKTTWFQDIWRVAWTWIKSAAVTVWDWLKGLPDKIGDVFGKVAGFISAPFRAGFNMVADAWNNTVGRLSWTVPDWVPFIGGNTISVPHLPHFHTGGVVPGAPGQEILAVLQAGERVTVPGAPVPGEGARGGDTYNITVTVPLDDLNQLQTLQDFIDMLRNNKRRGVVSA